MTMRDQITDILDEYSVNVEEGRSLDYVADAFIAALPDMIPDLVWRDNTKDGFYCETIFGIYGALKMHGSDRYLACINGVTFDHLHHANGEQAQAAANTHYKAQIMAALGVTT